MDRPHTICHCRGNRAVPPPQPEPQGEPEYVWRMCIPGFDSDSYISTNESDVRSEASMNDEDDPVIERAQVGPWEVVE